MFGQGEGGGCQKAQKTNNRASKLPRVWTYILYQYTVSVSLAHSFCSNVGMLYVNEPILFIYI